MSGNELRFRQVHLDYHNSPDIEQIGDDFNAEEFVSTLVKAKINSVTSFARCHHGMLYYDSKLFPERIHPNLTNRNMLQQQIEACHRVGIRVPVYITVQWDQYTAIEHPEWLARTEEGAVVGQKPFEAGFYGRLCVNSPYRDFLKAQTKEVLDQFTVDGFFFDIVGAVDCSCKYCRRDMEAQGKDPSKKAQRIEFAKQMIDGFKIDMTSFVRQSNQDCTVFYNRGHIGTAHRKVKEAYSHFEVESLPSGGWGYLHFPLTIRYARNLGLDCLSLTGKFHTFWGDFHSFKNKEALEFECFSMLAFNAKCMIGDQMEPNGKLSEPVYELIESIYSQVEQKEPWCSGAKAVTDIGVFTSEEFSKDGVKVRPEMAGAVYMLQESGHQFDIIDSYSDLQLYKLLILPDTISVDDTFAEKLADYIEQGGKVIATFESGLDANKTKFNLKSAGIRLREDRTTASDGQLARGRIFPRADYAEYLMPQGEIGKGLPETEHVMYIKGLEVEDLPGSQVLANTVLSYFNRTYKHFCSHRQTPSSGISGHPGIVRNENVIYFSHPIFTQYNQNAPKWCKTLLQNAIQLLLPSPLLRHDGPSTLLTTINEQGDENRWVVHLLHYIPQRKCKDIDIIEDIIPLYHVNLSVRAAQKVDRVTLVPQQQPLQFHLRDGRIEFMVPQISGHQMVEIKYGDSH